MQRGGEGLPVDHIRSRAPDTQEPSQKGKKRRASGESNVLVNTDDEVDQPVPEKMSVPSVRDSIRKTIGDDLIRKLGKSILTMPISCVHCVNHTPSQVRPSQQDVANILSVGSVP